MIRPFRLADLEAISKLPDTQSDLWLGEAEGSIEFLQRNAKNDEIVIYASTKCVIVHGVLAPTRQLTQKVISELQHSHFPETDDCWRIQQAWGGGQGHRMYLEPPLTSFAKSPAGWEKLIFKRRFEGVEKGPTPIELSQKLVHCLDLYFVPERSAYCRLDCRGDIEDVIKVTRLKPESDWDYLDVVTIQRKELDKFMALSNTSLIFRFDFTRVHWGSFHGWGEIQRYDRSNEDIYYHGGVSSQGSYCNGVMVLHPQVTVTDLIQSWKDGEDSKKKSVCHIQDF